MESSEDKHWAQKALIDPLNEPEPAAETGPGTRFRPESETSSINYTPSTISREGSKLKKNNPYRKTSSASKNPFVSEKELSPKNSYPSPPQSTSPRQERFSHRREAFEQYKDNPSSPKSPSNNGTSAPGRRRGSSLTERYPGDKSHKPLETIMKDNKTAYRAPHLRKNHQIRPDTIDRLDAVGNYHHEGPFDATYMARNTSYTNSPLEALARSNEEALKATPRDKIIDSVERHRPLDGVAIYPPGETDRNGQVYNYEPGENMMIDGDPSGGAYKRYPGVQYHPDDIKGKGEPSYSIEKALKQDRSHRSEMADGIEMSSTVHRPRSSNGNDARMNEMWGDGEVATGSGVGRSNTTGRQYGHKQSPSGGSIKRRFGSIRRSLGGGDKKHDEDLI